MRRDPTEFRKRFQRWKNGELVYKAGLPHYKDGKDATPYNKANVNINQATYIPEEDLYKARYSLPEVTVSGDKNKIGTGYGKRLYMHPWKTQGDLLLEASDYKNWRLLNDPYYAWSQDPVRKDLSKSLSPVDPVGEFVVGSAVLNPALKAAGNYLFGGIGDLAKESINNVIKSNSPISKSINFEKLNNVIQNLSERQQIPREDLLYIKETVLERMADNRGLAGLERKQFIDQGINIVDRGYMPAPYLENGVGGETFSNTGEVLIKDLDAFPHELRHRLDYAYNFADNQNYKLLPSENNLLKKAFNEDFINYDDITFMPPERISTLQDFRKELLGGLYKNMSRREQNIKILNSTATDMLNALRRSNDYGRKYYAKLLSMPRYTDNNYAGLKETLRFLKRSAIEIGTIVPPAIGVGTIYGTK